MVPRINFSSKCCAESVVYPDSKTVLPEILFSDFYIVLIVTKEMMSTDKVAAPPTNRQAFREISCSIGRFRSNVVAIAASFA